MKKEMIFSVVFLCIVSIWNVAVYAELIDSEKKAISIVFNSIEGWEHPKETDICLWTMVICNESHITELDLSQFGITDIPPEISGLTHLTNLDLSENKLETLPETIGTFQQLTKLNLSMNKLNTLPESFIQLKSLLELDLGGNMLGEEKSQTRRLTRYLDPPPPLALLEQLTQLKILKLNGNQIKELPPNLLSRLTSLETLYLNNNRLTDFPTTTNSRLTKLYLNQNEISSLPADINNYSALQELNLSNNKLESLSNAIGQLTALESLSITSNILSSISSEIGSLKALKKLALENNNLSSLPPSISQLESLTTLSLENNALQSLAETVANWKNLISLSLTNNMLKDLPDDFGLLESLITLDLENNVLEELPDTFGQLKMLEILRLSNNRLQELPANFNQLKNLLFVDLSNNQLIKLPEEISQLGALQTLMISSNHMEELPSDIGNLKNLRYLYASSNALTKTLTENFGNLKSIQEIDLSNNNLKALPTSFSNLETLQTLNLSSNSLEALPYSFGNLDNLQTVNFSNNRIKELKADFGDLSFLSQLYLSNNELKELPKEIGKLSSLTFLDLTHNKLESLAGLDNLSRLFTLDLSYNAISFLPETFSTLVNLRSLVLSNNLFFKFPEVILTLTNLLSLDLSNNPAMTDYIPFNFSNLDDLTDLKLDNTALYTYSQKMADFINERCRTCEFKPEATKTISNENDLILSGVTSTTDQLGIFKISDVIDIVLLFNAPVKLEQGFLEITFNTGYTTTISPFDSYKDSVNVTYTIHEGDNSEALNISQVTLSGGTLSDSFHRNAVLNLPMGANLSDNKILPIDGIPPEVTITQPESGLCYDTLDMIKGTADDDFNIKSITITLSSYTQTSKPAIYEFIPNENGPDEWVVDISKINWQNEPGSTLPERFEMKENESYTINVKVVDNVENVSETQSTFTYKKKSSEISCNVSSNLLTIGETLTITGSILPVDNVISDVHIEMKSEKGYVTTKTISANRDGSFALTTECTNFDHAGLWYITTIFDGASCIYGAESAAQPITIVKADTDIVLFSSEDAILNTDSFSISGKLTPTPGCYGNLLGLNIQLHIFGVDSGKLWDIPTVINTEYGHFSEKDILLTEKYPNEDISGQWIVSASFLETDSYLSSTTTDIKSVKVLESAGYAIIVQGKNSNEEGLASHQKTSDFVYNQFINRGLLDINDDDNLNDIQYFSYAAPGESGYTYIDNAPSKSLVKDAITVWAKKKMNAHPGTLYVVMVDHGLENQFIMDDENISSSELAIWQDDLYSGLSTSAKDKGIVTILGFCHSGSFIDELSGANRIIIASAAADEFSYKGPLDEDNIREGEYFIYEFFKKVALGKTIRTCFEEAAILTEKFTADLSGNSVNSPPYYDNSPQHPLLDDNADGVGSNSLESTNSDGDISSKKLIGVSKLTTNEGDLTVSEVSETQFLDYDEDPKDSFLWAKVNDNLNLATIWIEIKSPSYTVEQGLSSGQKVMNLKKIIYDTMSSDRYIWNGSALSSYFEEPGIYQIFYFAKDLDGNVSELKDSIVYKNKANNQSPLNFSLISPQNGIQISTKGVLFDCPYISETNCYTIFSWEETSDPDDDQITYNLILSKDDTTFSNPVQYNDDRLLNNSLTINLSDEWEGSDIYWKIQAIDQYGAIQESQTFHFKTISVTNPDTGTIQGYVYDSLTQQPIYRAMVYLDDFRMRTSSRGYYNGCLEPKLYELLSVVADNYKTQYYYSVSIDNGIILEQNIILEPESSDITGDINNDYAIDLFDLIAGIQILADIDTSTINILADANGDETIGIEDIIYIINVLTQVHQK